MPGKNRSEKASRMEAMPSSSRVSVSLKRSIASRTLRRSVSLWSSHVNADDMSPPDCRDRRRGAPSDQAMGNQDQTSMGRLINALRAVWRPIAHTGCMMTACALIERMAPNEHTRSRQWDSPESLQMSAPLRGDATTASNTMVHPLRCRHSPHAPAPDTRRRH